MSDSLGHRLMVAADAFETLGSQAHDPALTTTTCSEHAKLLREAERGIAEAEKANAPMESPQWLRFMSDGERGTYDWWAAHFWAGCVHPSERTDQVARCAFDAGREAEREYAGELRAALERARDALILQHGHRPGLSAVLVESIDPALSKSPEIGTVTPGAKQVGPGLFEGCGVCGELHCTCPKNPPSMVPVPTPWAESQGVRWCHKKTGGLYDVIAFASLEWEPATYCVVYEGQDGRVWVRPYAEFFDGRFERVDPVLSQGTQPAAERERIARFQAALDEEIDP